MSEPTPRRATVVGLGLVGSSVALALRKAGWHVTGTDIQEARAQRAFVLGVIDGIGIDAAASVGVVATTVDEIVPAALGLLDASPRMVVTDVGSVKARIVAGIDDPRFVGGHPMAGSEQAGPDGADQDLFVGATWVLTPTERTDEAAFATVRSLVHALGAEPVSLLPDRHDSLVAMVSHVPHLVAATLMTVASRRSAEHAVLLRLAAGGFRDMTRIAAGEPAMWPGVFEQNAEAVLSALDDVISELTAVRARVGEADREGIVALLAQASADRQNLPARVSRPEGVVECRVPVPDRPGVLADVATILGESDVDIFDFEIAHSAEGDRGVLIVTIAAAAASAARASLLERGYRPSIQEAP